MAGRERAACVSALWRSQLLRRLQRLQLPGGVFDHVGFVFEDFANRLCALLRLRPFFLLDGFADGGDCLHSISGVCPRGVDLVLEPGPFW